MFSFIKFVYKKKNNNNKITSIPQRQLAGWPAGNIIAVEKKQCCTLGGLFFYTWTI